MKTIVLTLFAFSLLFLSCDKESIIDTEDNITVGGVFMNYAQGISSSSEIVINVKDSLYSFDYYEAYYNSHEPASEQNTFNVYLYDTITDRSMYFEIFTKLIQPEDFFTQSTFNIDSIHIEWEYKGDCYYDANAIFSWDSVAFENPIFSGKASLNIPEMIIGKFYSETYFPKQTIEFEFK